MYARSRTNKMNSSRRHFMPSAKIKLKNGSSLCVRGAPHDVSHSLYDAYDELHSMTLHELFLMQTSRNFH
jgi:hypothetical protein